MFGVCRLRGVLGFLWCVVGCWVCGICLLVLLVLIGCVRLLAVYVDLLIFVVLVVC